MNLEILNQYKKFGEAEKQRNSDLMQENADSGSRSKFFQGVGGFLKILHNCQSGSWQMLTSNYKVGGWGEKSPKTCLRNI